jgi:hypothetical protein
MMQNAYGYIGTGWGQWGLRSRFQGYWRDFQMSQQTPGQLSASEVGNIHALFTQAQTFLDQRSYAYVRRALGEIGRKLWKGSLAEENKGNNE